MGIILASRGPFTQAAYELLHALPVPADYVVAMSICRSGQSSMHAAADGTRSSRIYSVNDFTSSLESKGIRSEGVVRTGCLINEVSSVAFARNADVIILTEAADKTRKLNLLASDGISVLKKTGKPVLFQPAGCRIRSMGSVLVAISGTLHSPNSQWHIENILDIAGKEIVVLAVSSPFYPVFQRVSVGIRTYQSEALREIWAEQAREASQYASLITSQLKEAGAKSWFITRTGSFVDEIQNAAQSVNASLVCVFVDTTLKRRWFGKFELADLMEAVDVPVMLVPCDRV